jgi:hypothetical protein
MRRPSAKSTFRILLVLAWLLPALNFERFGPLFRLSALTDRLPQHVYFAASLSSLLLCLTATIGLWLFQRWARVAYVIGILSYVYLMPVGWIVPGSFWFAVLPYLGAAIDGAIVTMSFLSPLALMFAKRKA